MNITMLLEMAASGDPDRLAIGRRADGLSALELFERAGRGAALLSKEGIRAVAFLGANGPAFPVALFAAAWNNLPFIPVNYRSTDESLVELLASHDDVLVIAPTDRGLNGLTHRRMAPEALLAATSNGEAAERWVDDPDETALLLYTSGTTSAPKAAVLRHRHLVSYVIGSVDFANADPTDAALVSVPPYHIAGVANLLSNLYAGRRIVYLDHFDAAIWIDTVHDEMVTHAMVVPTMLARVVQELDRAGRAAPSALRSLSYGGARLPVPVLERALELFPVTAFVNAYGLTETSSTIAVLGPDDHRLALAGDEEQRRRLGSAGRLLPGIEAEIRDETGSVLPIGEVGELWVRGEQVSGEYLSRDSPLDAAGWFPTRDRACLDGEGYLFLEGRSDDVIIRGGENIAPAEIEDVLLGYPGVGEAAVVGVPDDEWGQRLVAVVVAESGKPLDPEQVREFAREHLRSSKTPDEIHVWQELPHTATGKVLRRQILADLTDPSVAPGR